LIRGLVVVESVTSETICRSSRNLKDSFTILWQRTGRLLCKHENYPG